MPTKKKPPTKTETARREQRAAEREQCPVHGFERHGQEASELRRGLERIIKAAPNLGDERLEDIVEGRYVHVVDLEALLENVDARDACAYEERHPEPRPAWREMPDHDNKKIADREGYGDDEGEYGCIYRTKKQWHAVIYTGDSKKCRRRSTAKRWVEQGIAFIYGKEKADD